VITIVNNLDGSAGHRSRHHGRGPSENDIDMSIVDPAATVTGSIDLLVPFPPNPIGGPVVMTAPDASAHGAQNITGLTIGQIDMTAPTGIGENGISVDGPLPTGAVITVTVPTVSVRHRLPGAASRRW
jgi:hypothetical protein